MKFDHMLNGQGSRQHLQNMIKEEQHNRLIEDASKSQKSHQTFEGYVLKNDEQPKRGAVVQRIKHITIAAMQLLVK